MKTSLSMTQIPKENWNGKFAVMRQTLNKHGMKFFVLHNDVLSATEEAQRLNNEDPEGYFLVVKIVATVKI
jgi:hypothetical protein